MRYRQHTRTDAELQHGSNGPEERGIARLAPAAGEWQRLAGPTRAEWLRHRCKQLQNLGL
jgi:hypothetical protein